MMGMIKLEWMSGLAVVRVKKAVKWIRKLEPSLKIQ